MGREYRAFNPVRFGKGTGSCVQECEVKYYLT